MNVTQLELQFVEAVDPLAAFIERAGQDVNAVMWARNWVGKRGGNLHPEDIRQLRAALRGIPGYSSELAYSCENFMDRVAYGIAT